MIFPIFVLISQFTFNALETWRGIDLTDETKIAYAIIGSDALMIVAAILPVRIVDPFEIIHHFWGILGQSFKKYQFLSQNK